MSPPAETGELPSLCFRALTPEDLPQLMAIEEAVFPMPWPASVYAKELHDNRDGHYYALELTEDQPGWSDSGLKAEGRSTEPANLQPASGQPRPELLGYAGFWLLGDTAHLMTIAVAPDWQGHGLGTWLLLEVLDRMEDVGARVATLEVRAGNRRAIALYRGLGFLQVGRRRGYYTDNQEDALIMTTPALASPGMRALRREQHQAVVRRLSAWLQST